MHRLHDSCPDREAFDSLWLWIHSIEVACQCLLLKLKYGKTIEENSSVISYPYEHILAIGPSNSMY